MDTSAVVAESGERSHPSVYKYLYSIDVYVWDLTFNMAGRRFMGRMGCETLVFLQADEMSTSVSEHEGTRRRTEQFNQSQGQIPLSAVQRSASRCATPHSARSESPVPNRLLHRTGVGFPLSTATTVFCGRTRRSPSGTRHERRQPLGGLIIDGAADLFAHIAYCDRGASSRDRTKDIRGEYVVEIQPTSKKLGSPGRSCPRVLKQQYMHHSHQCLTMH
ncbi:hypothetical protein BD309DRAFT_961383 [Dichomitus squalens]|nr:hypothetical protein BD309DRAFT_961383 [Dichomitus squalens]